MGVVGKGIFQTLQGIEELRQEDEESEGRQPDHAFSGSAETFERLRRLGDWYVGIGGVLTFKKASLAETVKRIPLERILLETDAPYLTPVPHRGERNESAYIPLIADFLARQKGDTQPSLPKISCPSGNNGEYAEFYLSHRGQYINARPASKRDDGIEKDFENIYGDWFAANFGDKDSYYYRGAFMDCVQAVNFMATRSTSDMNNLFAEGSSQGGALCYAAAALSDIPFSAIAPNVAFLGDFPDYFRIVGWPGDTAMRCAKEKNMSDEEMYKFLSYFDTKNLATKISCPVWATSGLQDGTCPPHTNLAPFNNLLSTDKTMSFYPEMQHSYPPTWSSDISTFFKNHTK